MSNTAEPTTTQTFLVYQSTTRNNAGFGDRIVGLTSAILLAKWSNRRLMIDWQYPDLGVNYVNQFPFDASLISNMTAELLDCIDNRPKYKDRIESTPTISVAQVVFIECNQEIASFHEMARANFLKEVMAVYRDLFITYLKCVGPMHTQLSPKKKQIGIQIRAGDTHMNVGHVEFFSKQEICNSVLTQCVDFIRKSGWTPQDYEIFLTSDIDCVRELSTLLPEFYIAYNGGAIEHLGRQNSTNGTAKTLDDLKLLQKSDVFIISWHSNFGRMAALSAPLDRPVYLIVQSPGNRVNIRGPVKNKDCLTRKHSKSREFDDFNE